MKKITLVVLASALVLSGVALAQQSREPEKDSPMRGMMQEMMKGERDGQSGMGGMMEMMGQMDKMMDQCVSMMRSMQSGSEPPQQGQSR